MFHPLLTRLHRHVFAWVLGLFSASALLAQNTSALVYPGPDGKLVYAGYANQGQTSTGNRMIDFSHAGYRGGGVAIPWIPVAITLDPVPGTGDDHPRIQAAIDTISALPLSAAGFRGALLLRAGAYRVSQTLQITASGVVIRGEGQHPGGTVVRLTATVQDDLFEFSSSNGFWSKIAGTERAITDTLVPSGARSFNVSSTSGFSVGDKLMVHRTPNDFWIQELKMDQLQALAYANNVDTAADIVDWVASDYHSTTPRIITAITGNTLTVDAPLVHAIETPYGGGEVYRYQNPNALRNVGIERIRLESAYASDTDEAHGWNAVRFYQVENAWARQVTARYFAFSCVNIGYRCLYVTVEDCAQLDPKSTLTGGRRYSFNVDRSSFILMQRNYARDGRHDFVTGDRTRGPNVFVDSLAELANEDIGPHQRYAEGLLFDNIRGQSRYSTQQPHGGAINVQNRNWSGTGHGWSGAQTVLWNSSTNTYIICDAPKGAMNFSIGNTYPAQRQSRWGPVEPDGIWQSRNQPVTPRSLYYTQLADRLGPRAMATVTTAAQRQGTIWSALSTWKGDAVAPGLPDFAPLQVDAGDDVSSASPTLELNALIRYPLPDNFPVSQGWTTVSGPADAIFTNASSPSTSVHFPTPGMYELRFAISQSDNRDPANIIHHHGADSLVVTFTGPPLVTVGPSSVDSVVGRRQENASALGYYTDAQNNLIGGSGSTATLTREDRAVVLGYPLPALPVGGQLLSASFTFEITQKRSEIAEHPGLDVYLLTTATPETTGATLFHRGPADPNPELMRLGGVNLVIDQGPDVNFAAGAEVYTFTLHRDALAFLTSLYGPDGQPSRAEIFFRFNLNKAPATAGITLDRHRINIAPAGSGLALFATSPAIPPSPLATWLGVAESEVSAAFTADTNADGVPDGLAWLLGAASPTTPATDRLPTLMAQDDTLTLHFTLLAPSARNDAVVKIQYSPDLATWTTVPVPEASGTLGGIDFVITHVGDLVEVHATVSAYLAGDNPRLFLRLLGELPAL